LLLSISSHLPVTEFYFQVGNGLGVGAEQLVGGLIPQLPELVEQVTAFRRDSPFVFQALEKVGLASSVLVNMPILAATSWARTSPNCRSLMRQVFGSSVKYPSACVAKRTSCGS
jgi:hypothetical protein